MLRISKKADYAVFLLGAIARAGAYPGGPAGGAVVSAHEISKQAKLNKSVVANLLKEFAKHGLLESTRGLRGGYRLHKPPSQITLGEILEVIEGRFVLVDCIAHRQAGEPPAPERLLPLAPSMTDDADDHEHDCALISFCPSKAPMRVVHERIAQLFRTIHLDELCSLAPLGNPPTPAAAAVAIRR
jgi:Rrf2 family cysteine metabolism transcriptional repressor